MGGQAKSKKKNKTKRKDNCSNGGLAGLAPQERMKLRMHEKAKKKTADKYSVPQLLEKTEECMDSFDFEMASRFCQRALDLESTNLQALDMLGHIYSELGDTPKAKEISYTVALSPDEGHSKFMYLGQIHTGQEAVDHYLRGIQVLLSALEKQQAGAAAPLADDAELPTAKDVCVAYCSCNTVSLFVPFCEGAADKCREFIERALHYHHDNPEALQLMASYLFSTERNQEGREYLIKSVRVWLPTVEQSAASSSVEDEHLQNLIPPYESRITTAKLLIETEEYEAMLGLYPLQSSVSIIEEWYLQRETGVGGAKGLVGGTGRQRGNKGRKEAGVHYLDKLPPCL
uniref:Si:dkey-12j5.1 n=1 Tax=Myripristis murdjan TaxID=586833 RepID=A0A668A443_9TELE